KQVQAYGLIGLALSARNEAEARTVLVQALTAAEAMHYTQETSGLLRSLGQIEQFRQLHFVTTMWRRHKVRIMLPIAQTLGQLNAFDRAMAAAETLVDKGARAELLSGIAQAMVLVGEKDRVVEIADWVLAAVDTGAGLSGPQTAWDSLYFDKVHTAEVLDQLA